MYKLYAVTSLITSTAAILIVSENKNKKIKSMLFAEVFKGKIEKVLVSLET